jgi:hypothetical protein
MTTNPDLARWLPDTLPTLQRNIVVRALTDDGILEMPPGSNRSTVIDGYLDDVQSPRGSAWCAAALSAWFRDCGAKIPPKDAGSAEAWHKWAVANGYFTRTAQEGFAVLYGSDGVADHVGCVTRLTPIALNVEANTSATGYSREGVGCFNKPVWAAMVIGYVAPTPTGA